MRFSISNAWTLLLLLGTTAVQVVAGPESSNLHIQSLVQSLGDGFRKDPEISRIDESMILKPAKIVIHNPWGVGQASAPTDVYVSYVNRRSRKYQAITYGWSVSSQEWFLAKDWHGVKQNARNGWVMKDLDLSQDLPLQQDAALRALNKKLQNGGLQVSNKQGPIDKNSVITLTLEIPGLPVNPPEAPYDGHPYWKVVAKEGIWLVGMDGNVFPG